jgi:tight adherence protein B
MDLTLIAAVALAAVAAGGVAYVFLYPILSGSSRGEKRQKALVGSGAVTGRTRIDAATTRRDHVAQSLKDLEKREKTRNRLNLEMRIAQAGLTWTKRRFFVISTLTGLGLGAGLFVMTRSPILAGLAMFVGGFGLPRWILASKKKRRMNKYVEELPNAMDVIVRGIRSGLPLGDCMRIIAHEAQEPVRGEFRYLMEQQALGITVTDAVAKLYERVPVAESNFFAIVIGIQQKAGGNLSETLGNLSKVLRERKKMKAKITAMSMEAKASAAIIAALPFAVGLLTYFSSPTYVELLWTTTVGKIMLGISALWMMMGIGVMKKMINFDF